MSAFKCSDILFGASHEWYMVARERFIESRADILGGTPVICGTRITVYSVAGRIKGGDRIKYLVTDYPTIPREAFEAAELYDRLHPMLGRPTKVSRPWLTA